MKINPLLIFITAICLVVAMALPVKSAQESEPNDKLVMLET